MQGINKAILVGTLGADPEVVDFPNGGSITKFSIATSDSYIDQNTGDKKESTEWHNIILHNKLAAIAKEHLKKGKKVYIEGSLKTRSWTDDNNSTHYRTEIHGFQMQML